MPSAMRNLTLIHQYTVIIKPKVLIPWHSRRRRRWYSNLLLLRMQGHRNPSQRKQGSAESCLSLWRMIQIGSPQFKCLVLTDSSVVSKVCACYRTIFEVIFPDQISLCLYKGCMVLHSDCLCSTNFGKQQEQVNYNQC